MTRMYSACEAAVKTPFTNSSKMIVLIRARSSGSGSSAAIPRAASAAGYTWPSIVYRVPSTPTRRRPSRAAC